MANSFCEREKTICPGCGREFEGEIWLIVDGSERPDLLKRIEEGTLRTITCPQCNELAGEADAPTLLYRPDEDPRLIYAPSESDPDEDAVGLLASLRESLGPLWQHDWAQPVLRVYPPSLLPAALSGDPRLIAEALLEQTARELVRLEHERPDLHHELRNAFGRLE